MQIPPPLDDLPLLLLDPEREERIEAAMALREASKAAATMFRIDDDTLVLAGHGLGTEAARKRRIEANFNALELLQHIGDADRPLTAEEQATLAKYSGWGGLAEVFKYSSAHRAQLANLIGDDQVNAQGAGVLNAHFTPPAAVRLVYDALAQLGVQGGRVLEPSCGVGVFLGMTPGHWNANWTAIDIDPVNARISALLYRGARVLCTPFERAVLADGLYDVVVGNVPFGNYKVFDSETPDLSLSIHNAFIARCLRKLKPGGTLAVLTSTYTLDAYREAGRTLFRDSADLVGAFRLPSSMFMQSASVAVPVDLVILRKRAAGEAPGDDTWLWTDWDTTTRTQLNRYLGQRQRTAFLGSARAESTAHGGFRMVAHLDDLAQFPKVVAEAVASLPEGACAPLAALEEAAGAAATPSVSLPADQIAGTYVLTDDGGIAYATSPDEAERVTLNGKRAGRLAAMVRLREQLRALLDLQAKLGDSLEDEERIDRERELLQARYQQFVASHGALHLTANRRLFADDRFAALLLALEDWDEAAQRATPTPLLRQRTVGARSLPVKADNIKDALAIVLGACGRVDLAMIGMLLCQPIERVAAELAADELAFEDPRTGQWQVSALYLSGNIHAKLAAAEAAAAEHPRFGNNVSALRAAMPPRVAAQDIWVTPGCPLIRPGDLVGFIDHLRGHTASSPSATVERGKGLRRWKIQTRMDAAVDRTRWGLPEKPLCDLLADVCNNATPTVYRVTTNDAGNEVRIVDQEKSMVARSKAIELREEFVRWLLSDSLRRERVEDEYNRRFNTLRPAVYDGSHLSLPGLNARITAGAHQKDAIWRGVVGSTGVFHVVGAGKTLVACAIAMEARRLGLRRKPALVVPNHLVGKTATEFQLYYPCANLLVIDRDDFVGPRRRVMLARIATGDFDAVILSHSTFSKIPPDEAMAKQVLKEFTAGIDTALSVADDRSTIKQLQAARKRMEAIFEKFTGRSSKRQDEHITFSSLGIDALLVDESQAYKNLFYATARTRVAGLSGAASQRATDMFIKARAVQARSADNSGVIFLTGTPIANTMAEMFHVMRFLAMPMLRERGIDEFDDWANLFGEVVAALEVTPEGGGFRVNERFARFRNLPELMTMFSMFADVRMREDLNLPTPKVVGGGPQVIAVPASPVLKAYVQTLVMRAAKIRSPDRDERPDPSEDNMLLVVTDGRKAALDMRLVDPTAAEPHPSKLAVAAQNIARIYHATAERSLTQLVFCDLGTPSNTAGVFNVYEALREKLIGLGVQSDELAFIHDATTEAKRMALYAAVNRGTVRIVIGSTEKMGTGANMQRLLVANHDLDAPWRPDQVEQRAGRALRPGNLNEEIYLYRYVTEGTFDAYTWQLLESKARFIAQVMSGKCAVRSAEDVEARVMSYAEIRAAATGNPLIIEMAKLQAEAQQLRSMQRAYHETVLRSRRDFDEAEQCIARLDALLTDVASDRARWRNTLDANFSIELLGERFGPGQQGRAGRKLLDAVDLHGRKRREQVRLGSFAGFDLMALVGPFQPAVWLEGAGQYEVELFLATENSIVGRLREAVDLDRVQRRAQDRRAAAVRDRAGAEATLAAGFSSGGRLAEVEARLAEVERELGIADDSSGGAAIDTEVVETAEHDEEAAEMAA